MNDLKPCPFCGGESKRNDELSKGIEGVITCIECNSAAFISVWNTRPESAWEMYGRIMDIIDEKYPQYLNDDKCSQILNKLPDPDSCPNEQEAIKIMQDIEKELE